MKRLLKALLRWLEHRKELNHGNLEKYWDDKRSEHAWYDKGEGQR